MSDIDRVFSRFRGKKPESSDKRELLNIPRKGHAMGSRVVEVVHVRSGGASPGKGPSRRLTLSDRSATWEGGFPARPPAPPPALVETEAPPAAKPITHVMPMWEPAPVEPDAPPPPPAETLAVPPARAEDAPRQATKRKSARRVADPFDADDHSANCMRCGYAIEAARDKRGLLTCAACG